MNDERPPLRIVARTDPAALPPEPTEHWAKIHRMFELAFGRAKMAVRSVEGGKKP